MPSLGQARSWGTFCPTVDGAPQACALCRRRSAAQRGVCVLSLSGPCKQLPVQRAGWEKGGHSSSLLPGLWEEEPSLTGGSQRSEPTDTMAQAWGPVLPGPPPSHLSQEAELGSC